MRLFSFYLTIDRNRTVLCCFVLRRSLFFWFTRRGRVHHCTMGAENQMRLIDGVIDAIMQRSVSHSNGKPDSVSRIRISRPYNFRPDRYRVRGLSEEHVCLHASCSFPPLQPRHASITLSFTIFWLFFSFGQMHVLIAILLLQSIWLRSRWQCSVSNFPLSPHLSSAAGPLLLLLLLWTFSILGSPGNQLANQSIIKRKSVRALVLPTIYCLN